MNGIGRLSIVAMVLWLTAHDVNAGTNTGAVNVVNINRLFNGLDLQLNIPLTSIYETSCPWNNWIYLPVSDPLYPSSARILRLAEGLG
jgi:hypothetical protein